MTLLRFALFALVVGQWGCGNDGDPAPTAVDPVEAVLGANRGAAANRGATTLGPFAYSPD